MAGPTQDFWQQRFEQDDLAWDRGGPSPQLQAWLASGALQPCRIAVPGCGSGWEVALLARHGFDVVGLDYAPAAVDKARRLLADQGLQAQVLQADVLAYAPDRPFDAVYEQTCLCALHPDHWVAYAGALHRWLRPEGRLWALFLQMLRPEASETGRISGPPYHCDINAMRALFDSPRWAWPRPPLAKVDHPRLSHELAVCLQR